MRFHLLRRIFHVDPSTSSRLQCNIICVLIVAPPLLHCFLYALISASCLLFLSSVSCSVDFSSCHRGHHIKIISNAIHSWRVKWKEVKEGRMGKIEHFTQTPESFNPSGEISESSDKRQLVLNPDTSIFDLSTTQYPIISFDYITVASASATNVANFRSESVKGAAYV